MQQPFQKRKSNISDVGIVTESYSRIETLAHIVEIIMIGVVAVPKGKPPRRFQVEFYRIKLGFVAAFGFAGLGMLGVYFGIEEASYLFDMSKISLGFGIGSGISFGFSK